MNFEKLFAICLLRLPGEPLEAPLDRLNSLQVQPSASDFKDAASRRIVKLAYDLARSERTATLRFAAQKLNINETDLIGFADKADPEAFALYAEHILNQQQADNLSSAAQEAVDKARAGDGRAALDSLSDKIAALQAANEDAAIVDLREATTQFLEWYQQYQDEMKSGKVRWSFQSEKLDDMLPYIFPGHAILVTAPSKVGKSSLVQQWFDYNTARGLKGIFFHFEDSPEVMGLKRVARQMITIQDTEGNIIGLSQKKLLSSILSRSEMALVASIGGQILNWKNNAKFVHSAGWTMEQCMRVVWRYRDWADFFVIDYVGKEFFPPGKLRNYGGPYGAAAYDAELIKTTTDRLGKIAVVVQQEHEDGKLYGTRQTWQKFQAWFSLKRETENSKLSGTTRADIGKSNKAADGEIVIRNANMGETGSVPAWFYPEFGLWAT